MEHDAKYQIHFLTLLVSCLHTGIFYISGSCDQLCLQVKVTEACWDEIQPLGQDSESPLPHEGEERMRWRNAF